VGATLEKGVWNQMTDKIDPRFLEMAKAIVDRITPGMVEREPETIAAWFAQSLRDAFEAGELGPIKEQPK